MDAQGDKDCYCWLCAGGPATIAHDEYDRNTVWHVQEYGWSVVGVADEHELPGWAYSVGMWHSMRSPEVCIFGLRVRDMQVWVNAIGAQIRAGQPLRVGERRMGVLDGFPVWLRPVDPTWYPDMFGMVMHFYQRPPVPVLQMIWPDREGRFPWEPDAGERCRTAQPRLWLPKDDHPPGVWTRLGELAASPFPGTSADELVLASRRVIDGEAPIVGILHTERGQWEFLDGEPIASEEDLGMVHLRHLVVEHPHISDFADMPRGHQAWQQPDGNWSRSPSSVD